MSKTLNESELQEKMVQIYKEEQKKVIEEKWIQYLKNKFSNIAFVIKWMQSCYRCRTYT